MSTRIRSMRTCILLAITLLCSLGCRSDGQTTQIGYHYDGPMLMESARLHDADTQK